MKHDMMLKRYLLIHALLVLFGISALYGQVNMSGMGLDCTDSLQKNRIRYFSYGSGGRNRLWDFSKRLWSNESSKVVFMKDSIGIIMVNELGNAHYYRTTPDTIILMRCESSLEEKIYPKEKKRMVFPLVYGDSISGEFICDGVYCGNHSFREIGTRNMKVDAVGSIVLAQNDTIHNVKRVHTIDTYSVCMDIDVAALDTARLVQVIDERYEWYIPDSQYPIIENVASTTYMDMEAVGTARYAYCNLPEDKVAFYMTEEESEEEDCSFDMETTKSDIIHYSVQTTGKVIHFAYNLDEDASISIIVSSHMGMTYRYKEWTQDAGVGYAAHIDCNGLPSGIYILYINVNGKVYSEKVTL